MMPKYTLFIITTLWTLTAVLVLIRPKAFGACIHDQISSNNVSVDQGQIRTKRQDSGLSYDDLKIFTHIDEIDVTLSFNAINSIDRALRQVTETLSRIFKVTSMPGKFLLQRQNCKKRWNSGMNKGKCAEIQSEIEYCSIKNTEYVIPGTFLDGLEAYNEAEIKPYKKFVSGRGIDGYNFILFVISRSNAWCKEKDVQAYASFCRTDSSNRPIAGILNMCPDYFRKKIYDKRHYYNVILHEVLHVLGFSESLFSKFKGCSLSDTCDKLSKNIKEDASGIPRLQFSPVIKATQEHFSCKNSDFGAPVAFKSASDKQITSHWHPFLMFSSIMVPSFSEDDISVLDKITLSLFESTGWYKINFSAAEYFQFGKGKGCDFGSSKSCEVDKNTELCTVSSNKTGCDLMNLGISYCQSVASDQPCGVFKPSFEGSCDKQYETEHGIEVHELNYVQRCFITQTGKSTPEPSCLFVKCLSKNSYEVLHNSTWLNCGNQKNVNDSQTVVTCIPDLPVCHLQTQSVRSSYCDSDTNYVISLRMHFLKPTYSNLIKKENLKFFKIKTLHAIAKAIEIPVTYIVNATLSVFKQVFLDFSVCPPKGISNAELGRVILKTQKFLKSGVFSEVIKGSQDFIISSTDMAIHPSIVTTFTDYEGFRTLLAIPIICGIFLLATLTTSLIRLYMIQKHKPRRAAERPDSDNLDELSTEDHTHNQGSSTAL